MVDKGRSHRANSKYFAFNNEQCSRHIRPDVKSIMVVESCHDILWKIKNFRCEIYNDYAIMHQYLFVQNLTFPEDFRDRIESNDIEMIYEHEPDIEIIPEQMPHLKKYEDELLVDEKDLNIRNWDVNLRDKLNLKKYTKKIYSNKAKHKQRIGSLKDQISSQHMYQVQKPVEPDKLMKNINLDQSFEVDYVELLTKYEFPAVLRLKKKFMTWFCKYMHEKIQQKKRDLEERKLQKEDEERQKKMKEEEEAEIKARKDATKISIIQPKIKTEAYEITDIDLIDPMEDNPSKILQCALCLRRGQRKLSGRLIPFRANQFIHVNCALWTDNVFDDKEGHIINFYFSYKRAKLTKCTYCNELGASISCERLKCD